MQKLKNIVVFGWLVSAMACGSSESPSNKPTIKPSPEIETYFETYAGTYLELTVEAKTCHNRAEEVFDVRGFESLMDKEAIAVKTNTSIREVELRMTKNLLDCSQIGEYDMKYSLVLPPDSIMQHITITHPSDIVIKGMFYDAATTTLSDNVEGVVIPTDLFEISKSTNAILVRQIRQSLKKQEVVFERLINFDCGGGAGCYDLGAVVLQVADRLGEEVILEMAKDYHPFNKRRLMNLLFYGFEYGDVNEARQQQFQGTDATTKFQSTFPRLFAFLDKK